MTEQNQDKSLNHAMELLIDNGFEGAAEVIGVLLNTAMAVERSAYLDAQPYERTAERRGAGGFHPPGQARGRGAARSGGEFESSIPGCKRARRHAGGLEAWRTRPLDGYPYVVLDAQYQKVRQGGRVRDAAVLIAAGVDTDGKRDVLGCFVSLSEHEVHWRAFLSDLKDRGLHGMQLIVSDAHEGLAAARRAVFPSVPWQRCQFHLQQNAGAYVPTQAERGPVAVQRRAIFTAPDRGEAERLLERFVERHAENVPKLSQWAEHAIPQCLTVFDFPETHRRRLRTSNVIERLNKEIKRRTRVASLFPNEASCLRLVSAIVMEIADEWPTGRVYLNIQQDK